MGPILDALQLEHLRVIPALLKLPTKIDKVFALSDSGWDRLTLRPSELIAHPANAPAAPAADVTNAAEEPAAVEVFPVTPPKDIPLIID